MFLNILPDPNYKINDAGIEDAGGTAGPGFSTVSCSVQFPNISDLTIGGKSVLINNTRPTWDINIKYNPLTQAEFAPVYYFLLEKVGSYKSFYVSLPQYKAPKDVDFAAYVDGGSITSAVLEEAGAMSMQITAVTWSSNTYADGVPKTGDVFTITDPEDSLNTQAYMVSHIDTYTTYETQPASGNVRIHFFPGLQRHTAVGAAVNFNNPLFKVTQKQDIQEYTLDNDGLYAFSLSLQEALY